ncbi:Integral membrane protein CcmA involved in cell shape determination [Desulfosporosinus orientis DSM 765]|uniref:Integral membrane protein CcmA involved in cell shape determination n=1 Tax=Desulfosporosinus orientis (strain ATCC 19365 / DSM 765 / NCIMB 8382 / VKM B-1628 / Singapore I) TaxID=768706 RepID=G7WH65_DESOD|nr:Integral membrane protein CcmA [Desulfosporosinus orientis]AET69573.1 Integral membrane protein CcmA involved in cell shape determination [Desulfosporosinus orientis DSM 765]
MNNHDVRIMGESSLSGGVYGKVKIMGSVWAQDDLEAEKIRVFGTAEFRSLKAGELKVAGTARFEGSLNVRMLDITGSVDALETIKAHEIKLYGSLTAKKEVIAEKFLAKGTFELSSLNANDVRIELADTCRVEEIGAENVKVGPISMFNLAFFGSSHKKSLRAGIIEADNIELSNTAAQTVKGIQVIIGPCCEIGTVEYQDSLKVHPGSTVKNPLKIK